MIIIYMLSNLNGTSSTGQSNIIVNTIFKFIKIDKSILIPMVRKTAHITEYFILFILIYINIKEYKIKDIYKVSILLSILYAIFDEFHQLFINERSGKVTDVLIDSVGVIIGYLFIKFINKRKNK
ncbi:MAG: VanZ family protein [Bacilli bacterium]|nr:VanZ family protein [Bacilli bacterium]